MSTEPLAAYRRKRRPGRTPEPLPSHAVRSGDRGDRPAFVIQEHHASSLHWDFRLEHRGVLASWALPKGLPVTPGQNRLAVQVEDHPLEYGTFSGTIPAGQYGAGTVTIWDSGTFDCEAWGPREIKVVLHGGQASGRYVLFPTKGANWMIHRMDPAPPGFEPLPSGLRPMLAVPGPLPPDDDGWAFEFKWDGMRALIRVDGGRVWIISRNGRDVTGSFPELKVFGEALGARQGWFDGELVVLGDDGVPSFGRLQHRIHAASATHARAGAVASPVSLVLFDLLHLDGRSLLALDYDHRRSELEALELGAPRWGVAPSFTSDDGDRVYRAALTAGMEGVVAKRRSSTYQPGLRSRHWIKVKDQRTQEVVIGGFTRGKGSRAGDFGALLLGIPAPGGRRLTFVGKVGTGFSDRSRADLLADLRPSIRRTSPFGAALPAVMARDATWVTPRLVGEVRFAQWTGDGHLRHPVWRGLRPDKRVDEVRREP